MIELTYDKNHVPVLICGMVPDSDVGRPLLALQDSCLEVWAQNLQAAPRTCWLSKTSPNTFQRSRVCRALCSETSN